MRILICFLKILIYLKIPIYYLKNLMYFSDFLKLNSYSKKFWLILYLKSLTYYLNH